MGNLLNSKSNSYSISHNGTQLTLNFNTKFENNLYNDKAFIKKLQKITDIYIYNESHNLSENAINIINIYKYCDLYKYKNILRIFIKGSHPCIYFYNYLPPYLDSLNIYNNFDMHIKLDYLPLKLHHLKCIKISNIKLDKLPPNLHYLKLSENYNVSDYFINIIKYGFNESINDMPIFINRIILPNSFNRNIDNLTSIPNINVIELHNCTYNRKINYISPTLEILMICIFVISEHNFNMSFEYINILNLNNKLYLLSSSNKKTISFGQNIIHDFNINTYHKYMHTLIGTDYTIFKNARKKLNININNKK